MKSVKRDSILDSVVEDVFSTMPLVGRSVRRKLLKSAIESFEAGISPPHFEILKLLEEAGKLHIAEIGERLQIARPQMTHLIDRLVELGLVEREPGTEDRRMIHVTLTAEARELIKEHEDELRKATMESLSSLTVGELEELSASLRTLREILSKLE